MANVKMTPRQPGWYPQVEQGRTDNWWTPPSIFDALGVDFDLDPASPITGPVPWIPATRFMTEREDGLSQPWQGCVWLNPPYGNQTARWLDRLARHGNGIALVFARTDTQWFQDLGTTADAICFVRGRVQFVWGKDQSTKRGCCSPSVLLAWGHDCALAVRQSGLGVSYPLHNP